MSFIVYYGGSQVFSVSHQLSTLLFWAFFIVSLILVACTQPRLPAAHGHHDDSDNHQRRKSSSPQRLKSDDHQDPGNLV